MRTIPNSPHRLVAAAMVLIGLSAISGCRSHHIEATIENHTGGGIKLLEVDYPTASFGADMLGADSVMHYRIQTRGSGPISVQYTGADGHAAQIKGPDLYEGQEGRIEIVLLPDGKAEFHPSLNPQHS